MQHTRGRPAPRPDPWRRLDATQTWADLVLPSPALAQLQSVPGLLSRRYWSGSAGPADESRRRGVLLLFAGQAGTGKTMAAQVLARELGLPMLRADLEGVFAGGRGEAARLMARLFATAQRLGAVLEIGRCDVALSAAAAEDRPMSTRVAAADLRDLMERCDSHPGVVVFTTTRTREIDPGARERFDATIEFPFPEQPARAEIWRRSLPADVAVSEADRHDLAAAFPLPGAAIASSCATAAGLAAAEGAAVSMTHIAQALEQEYATRLVSDHTRSALRALRERAGSGEPRPALVAVPEAMAVPSEAVAHPPEVVSHPPEAFPPAQAPAPDQAPSTVEAPLPAHAPAPEEAPPPPEAPPPGEALLDEIPPPGEAPASEAPAHGEPAPAEPAHGEPAPEEPPTAEHAALAPAAAGVDLGGPIDEAAADRLVQAMARSAAVQAATSEAERPRRGRWRRALRRFFPLALLGLASAIALGLAAAHQRNRSTSTSPATPDASLTTRDLSVRYPAGWQRQSPPAFAHLTLHGAVALASTQAPAGRLVIGVAPAQSRDPLPHRFIAAALPGTPTPQLVTLGGQRFERVLDPRLALTVSSQSVYARASPAGPVVAVCETSTQAFTAACERVLATLQVTATPARSAAQTAKLAYAHDLNAVLSRLDRARAGAAHELSVAKTAKDQAKAAGLLAGLHAQASGQVAGLPAGPASTANAKLAAALRDLADAYGRVGRAALHDDPVGYRTGQADVAREVAAVATALGGLRALGYDVR